MIRAAFLAMALATAPILIGQTATTGPSKSAKKARTALDNNKPYSAIRRCDKGLDRKVPDSTCFALRAEAENRIGDPRTAIVDARKGMLFKSPSAMDARLQLGIAYHAIGMRDSAEWAFIGILEQSTEARYRLALVERETGRAQAALEHLNEAVNATPVSARCIRERGVTQAMLGDSAAARADLDKAIELEPKNPVNWNTRGFQRYALFGEHQRAIKDYEQAIKLDKNHGYAFNNRGWSRYKLGNAEAALRDIRLAGRKNPSNSMVDRNLGVIALEQGNLQLACTHWRDAMDKDFTARFGGEVEELVKQHCGRTTSPAPKDIQDRNAPKPAPAPKRGNAP